MVSDWVVFCVAAITGVLVVGEGSLKGFVELPVVLVGWSAVVGSTVVPVDSTEEELGGGVFEPRVVQTVESLVTAELGGGSVELVEIIGSGVV